jgi:alpha-beta hydrolase superfamily lysophospholipase
MQPLFIFVGIGIFIIAGFYGLRQFVFHQAEKSLLTTKPNGRETPADLGLDYEALTIPSVERRLEAWLVKPSPSKDARKAILIFHGRNESISEWVPVQYFLCTHGITSLVFDYSGFGNSSGRASVANLRQDVRAADQVFQSKIGQDYHKYVLGLSLGSGFLLEGILSFTGHYDGVILVAAYTSARDAAAQTGTLPSPFTFLLPDVYNNVRMVQQLDKPLLIIHSQDDEVFPSTMAEKIYAAAHEPKQLVLLRGLKHNNTLEGKADAYLSPMLEFLGVSTKKEEGGRALKIKP